MHDTININILDEDRRGAPEFLGRIGVPLLMVGCFALYSAFRLVLKTLGKIR